MKRIWDRLREWFRRFIRWLLELLGLLQRQDEGNGEDEGDGEGHCPHGCGPHPESDVSVFLTPDGTPTWGPMPNKCPMVIVVHANEGQVVAGDVQCNPNFNYQPFIDAARARVAKFIQDYDCPAGCPYKEHYPDPNVATHISTDCIPMQVGTGFNYTAAVDGYFVCTDLQI